MQFRAGSIPSFSSSFVLLHAHSEVIQVAQIRSTGSISFTGRLLEELRGERLIFGETETPHIHHAEIDLGTGEARSSGELVPMHGSCWICWHTDTSLVEESYLFCRFGISAFGGLLIPVCGLLRILRHTVASEVSCG